MSSKPMRTVTEYRSHTGPPGFAEKPVCTETPFSEYDPEKAVEYLKQAAAKDNAFAKYQLGKLFCQGRLVQKDIARGPLHRTASTKRL